jgi:hypothetical protein
MLRKYFAEENPLTKYWDTKKKFQDLGTGALETVGKVASIPQAIGVMDFKRQIGQGPKNFNDVKDALWNKQETPSNVVDSFGPNNMTDKARFALDFGMDPGWLLGSGIGKGSGALANLSRKGLKGAKGTLTKVDDIFKGIKNKSTSTPPPKDAESLNKMYSAFSKNNKSEINKILKDKKDWLNSDEYLARRMDNTGESAKAIKKDVALQLNTLDRTPISFENMKDMLGYAKAENLSAFQTIRGVIPKKKIALNPDYASDVANTLGTLSHEVDHVTSPLQLARNYDKGYPHLNLLPSNKNKKSNLLQKLFYKKNDNAFLNYMSEPIEQQARFNRANPKIRKDLGLDSDTKILTEEQLGQWLDGTNSGKFRMGEPYSDVTELLDLGAKAAKNKKTFRRDLLDVLNKAWAVPGAVGAGALGTMSQKAYGGELPKAQFGTWISKLAKYVKPKPEVVSKIINRSITPIGYDPFTVAAAPLELLTPKALKYKPKTFATKNRFDAWKVYNGLEPDFNTFSRNADGTLAINDFRIDKNTLQSIISNPKSSFGTMEIENQLNFGGVHGNGMITKGKDELGKFIDFTDTWDLQPFKNFKNLPKKARDFEVSSLTSGKPFDLKNRIYYDNSGNFFDHNKNKLIEEIQHFPIGQVKRDKAVDLKMLSTPNVVGVKQMDVIHDWDKATNQKFAKGAGVAGGLIFSGMGYLEYLRQKENEQYSLKNKQNEELIPAVEDTLEEKKFGGELPKAQVGTWLSKAGKLTKYLNSVNTYNKIVTGNSILPYALKLENSIIPKSTDYIKKLYTDNQIELLDKYGAGMQRLSPEDWESLVEFTKSGATDFSKGDFPISRMMGYYDISKKAEENAIKNLKLFETFTFPEEKNIRTWSAGIPTSEFERTGVDTRLVIPSKYTKKLGDHFAGMPYTDKRSSFIWRDKPPQSNYYIDEYGRKINYSFNKNAIKEKELLGALPNNSFTLIGKTKANGINNLIIKPNFKQGGNLPKAKYGKWMKYLNPPNSITTSKKFLFTPPEQLLRTEAAWNMMNNNNYYSLGNGPAKIAGLRDFKKQLTSKHDHAKFASKVKQFDKAIDRVSFDKRLSESAREARIDELVKAKMEVEKKLYDIQSEYSKFKLDYSGLPITQARGKHGDPLMGGQGRIFNNLLDDKEYIKYGKFFGDENDMQNLINAGKKFNSSYAEAAFPTEAFRVGEDNLQNGQRFVQFMPKLDYSNGLSVDSDIIYNTVKELNELGVGLDYMGLDNIGSVGDKLGLVDLSYIGKPGERNKVFNINSDVFLPDVTNNKLGSKELVREIREMIAPGSGVKMKNMEKWGDGRWKEGGSVELGDVVDKTTMERLKAQGYTFEEI